MMTGPLFLLSLSNNIPVFQLISHVIDNHVINVISHSVFKSYGFFHFRSLTLY